MQICEILKNVETMSETLFFFEYFEFVTSSSTCVEIYTFILMLI